VGDDGESVGTAQDNGVEYAEFTPPTVDLTAK
jgi:hypothetical protein